MKKFAIILGLTLVILSCEKEELPVDPATTIATTAGLGSDYATMMYYNLLSGEFVKTLPHTGYDLQLECSESGKYIYLNSSDFMFVRNRGVVDFASVTDTSGIAPWKYDYPTGAPNRTAIGTWFNADGTSKNEVFVVNRGFDERGENLGFFKMMVQSANSSSYVLRVATLDNSLDTTISITKDESKNRIHFSFEVLNVVDIEPISTDWHLHFTQYTDYDITDDGDTIPYLVRGALINPNTCSVAKLETADYEAITADDVQNLNFSGDENAIGYDWKSFSLDTGIYSVLPDVVYIIKEQSGLMYKLRFVEYYNDAGEKGFLKFEVVSL